MQTVVDQATILPAARNDPIGWAKKKLTDLGPSFDLPADAKMDVQKQGEIGLRATLRYTQPVNLLPFGLYVYPYEFNHTATTDKFLTK